MRRKVNRVGTDTLTVSLPKKWVVKNSVCAGDELTVHSLGKNLVITSDSKLSHKKASLSLDGLHSAVLHRALGEFYTEGIDSIELKYSKEIMWDCQTKINAHVLDIVQRRVSFFIGLEIVSHTDSSIKLQCFATNDSARDLPAIQLRLYHVFKENLKQFRSAMDEDFSTYYHERWQHTLHLWKFVLYYRRLIRFSDIDDVAKTRLMAIAILFDKIVDIIRYVSELVHELDSTSPELKKCVEGYFDNFLDHFKVLNNPIFSEADLSELVTKRFKHFESHKMSDFNQPEKTVVAMMRLFTSVTGDIIEVFIALNLSKYIVSEID